MPQGVLTIEALERVVDDYFEFDEFVVDVETMGDYRLNPQRNDVFWIALAGPGRCDVIPCGHPVGERVNRPQDEWYRVAKNGHHQEHRINPDTGRLKWFDVPEPFHEPPKQLWRTDVIEILRPLFFSKRIRLVGHNINFDIESLAKYFGALPPGPYGDTMVAARLIDENQFVYKLGQVIQRELGFSYEKIGKEVEKYPYSEAYMYSYYDAKYTWLLWERFKPMMEKEKVRHIFDLEMDLLPAVMDVEKTGITIDEHALDRLDVQFKREIARLKVAIDEVAGYDINLNANAQVANLIYETRGHMCKFFTPTGKPSTKAEDLEDFNRDPVVRDVLEYAKVTKLHSTFIVGIRRNLENSVIHPRLNSTGARTGRMSSSEPNIQQIPIRSERGKQVREVFIAAPGKVLIVSDLSQIELRVLAHFTQDRMLLRAYRNGLDLHGLLAARVFGADFTPTDRIYAKNGNFSVLFGASPATLVKKYEFPNLKLAKAVQKGFYETYKKVEPWKEEVLTGAHAKYKKGKSPPYVTTILGRKRRLPYLRSKLFKRRGGAERQAISSIIQGTAADIFKLGMIDCHNQLQAQKWGGHILMTVHDEMVVEVPERYGAEALHLVKSCMENVKMPGTEESILSVPIVAEASIVQRWSDAKG